jgi:hypothetical protein
MKDESTIIKDSLCHFETTKKCENCGETNKFINVKTKKCSRCK